MTTDLLDLRRRLRDTRNALNFAWSNWAGMKPPKSVSIRARIVWGEDWMLLHPDPEDQQRGLYGLAVLRAQTQNAELEEAGPGQA